MPCLIPAGLNLPALHSVTLGDWIGVLTAKSNLMADTITINPRTGLVNNDLVIGPKATVTATSDLEFLGGAVAGGPTATLRANGTLNVNGASAADKPTLGVMLQVGDGAAPTIMTLMDGSQPLVVKGSARITVNERASLFIRSGESKKAEETVTAVSNGDSGPLTIALNGGTLKRFADGQVYVGMGVTIENGGKLVAYAGGHSGAGPLHIVWQNANGTGLDVSRGTVEATGGDLWVDGHAYFYDGTVIVGADATFTVGTNVKSPMSCMYGGTFDLKGTLEAHGGFGLFGGTLGTDGSTKATMRVDDGNRFWLNDGGELDVTKGGNGPNAAAAGGLVISGDFTASRGTIVNNVDSRAHGHAQGNFRVTGNVTLAADTIFSSRDLNPNAGAVGRGWRLFSWEGTRSGACGFNLPPKWATAWTDATPTAAGYLGVMRTEPRHEFESDGLLYALRAGLSRLTIPRSVWQFLAPAGRG